MRSIEKILAEMNIKSLHEYSAPFANPNPVFTEMDYKLINKLFVTFQSIFPAFKQAWPTEDEFLNAKREWMKAFKQVKLEDIELIKIGVMRFRLLPTPFVPSPGQFIQMCKRPLEEHGLKTPEMAFREACEQSNPTASKIFSHAVVKLARDLTGSFFLSTHPRSKTFPVFEKHYKDACELFIQNRNLKQIKQETPQEKYERREPDVKEEFKECKSHASAMAKIKEFLN